MQSSFTGDISQSDAIRIALANELEHRRKLLKAEIKEKIGAVGRPRSSRAAAARADQAELAPAE